MIGMGIGMGIGGGGNPPRYDNSSPYYRQVSLLVSVLPLVAQEPIFALKGGTAINLFIRDLPRLSVDIDLVYLPMDDREKALENIKAALDRIAKALKNLEDALSGK